MHETLGTQSQEKKQKKKKPILETLLPASVDCTSQLTTMTDKSSWSLVFDSTQPFIYIHISIYRDGAYNEA